MEMLPTLALRDPFCQALVTQINGTAREGHHDACAVLCRRLAEALVLRAFCSAGHRDVVWNEKRGWSALGTLIGLIRSRKYIEIDPTSLEVLSEIKALGNDGAHHPERLIGPEEIAALRPRLQHLVDALLLLVPASTT